MAALLLALFGHLYLWRRLVRDTTRRGTGRRLGTALLGLLAGALVATLSAGRELDPRFGRWLAWPGYLWLAVAFYLLLVRLVLELPQGASGLRRRWRRWRRGRRGRREVAEEPPDPARRLFLARSAALVAGAGAVGLVGYGAFTALGAPEVRRVTVPLSRLDPRLAGLRIAAVSDLHLGQTLGRSHTERMVRMVNGLHADLVAVVGDLVDGTVAQLRPAVAPLRDLVARHGSFFVTGNHEYYSGAEPWIAEVQRLGLTVLRNERVAISHDGSVLDLAGVTDVTGAGHGDPPNYAAALDGRDRSRAVVLLAHQPVQVHQAARHGVDLQISGHTHGGQLWPFHYVVRSVQPVLAGLARVDGTWLYVTRGVGTWGPPVRVGAPPEITLIELRPAAAPGPASG